ncbi:MAG: hypothetical protein KF873_00580 [Gemmataceae bacterium]|nr:hypothetical protein [Gemmataceae bacterium]
MAVPRKPHGIGDRHVGSDFAADEIEFLRAMEHFKRSRPFPTWTEVLKVLKGLGYRKVDASVGEAPGGGDGAAGNGTALLPPP